MLWGFNEESTNGNGNDDDESNPEIHPQIQMLSRDN